MTDLINVDMPTPLTAKPLPDDAPEWAKVLNENIETVMDTMNSTMITIDAISSEVQPMVDGLSNHPMLKMFIGKGK